MFELRQRVMDGPVVVVVLPREDLDLLGQQPAEGEFGREP